MGKIVMREHDLERKYREMCTMYDLVLAHIDMLNVEINTYRDALKSIATKDSEPKLLAQIALSKFSR